MEEKVDWLVVRKKTSPPARVVLLEVNMPGDAVQRNSAHRRSGRRADLGRGARCPRPGESARDGACARRGGSRIRTRMNDIEQY